jgi:hypothetical protein
LSVVSCIGRCEEVEALFCEAQMILMLAAEKMYYFDSSAEVLPKLLNALISMVFSTIVKFEDLKPADGRIKEVWQDIHKSVTTNWIIAHFSPQFGKPDEYGKFQAAMKDIEVRNDANVVFLMCIATVWYS